MTSVTTARTPNFGHLGGGGPGHHGLVSGCLLEVQRAVADSPRCSRQGGSQVVRSVCQVWPLSSCHVRAPLKGVHLWVLVAAFFQGFYNWKGLLEIASWFTVKCGLALVGRAGCGCLEGLFRVHTGHHGGACRHHHPGYQGRLGGWPRLETCCSQEYGGQKTHYFCD